MIYGAGGGIGGAVARAFAREGANLFLSGRHLAKVEQVAREPPLASILLLSYDSKKLFLELSKKATAARRKYKTDCLLASQGGAVCNTRS